MATTEWPFVKLLRSAVICPPSAGKTACYSSPRRSRSSLLFATSWQTWKLSLGKVCRGDDSCASCENIFKILNNPPCTLFHELAVYADLGSCLDTTLINHARAIFIPHFLTRSCLQLFDWISGLNRSQLFSVSFLYNYSRYATKFGSERCFASGPLFQMDLHFTLNELHIALLTQICSGQHAHREFQFQIGLP